MNIFPPPLRHCRARPGNPCSVTEHAAVQHGPPGQARVATNCLPRRTSPSSRSFTKAPIRSDPRIHCALGHSFLVYSGSIAPGGGKSFGDDDGRAPHRICRGDCSRLFRVSAHRKQPIANAINGVNNGKSRSNGATDGFSTVRLYRADPCRNFCFHVCLVGREGIRHRI